MNVFTKIFRKVFVPRNERVLKKLWPTVHKINDIYEKIHNIKDEDLIKKTEEWRKAVQKGEVTLDEILPEAYAYVKETCRRLVGKSWDVVGIKTEWNMIPFDVQLIGAIVLHQGKIAEMATGEGKTLVATMPLYLNALTGKNCNLVTVNDYLAKRDREWMGPVYESLGVSVGVIQAGMEPQERKPHYEKDITYGTNNEFGFDYLRDNMVFRAEDRVQRDHYYAIIDEVDSILIDEARTPLIISGPVERSSNYLYRKAKPVVEEIVRKQNLLVNKILQESEKLLRNGDREKAAEKLLLAKRGAPRSKRLFKLLQEPDMMRLVESFELRLMKEKKMHEFDQNLYYVIDEKAHSADITEKGREEIHRKEKDLFVLPDLSTELHAVDQKDNLTPREKFFEKERILREYSEKSEKVHAIKQLLKAYSLFEKDVDYVVMDGKVIIVDEFTGRLMHGRRWSDGLHEAVEAKENVTIQRETQTLATITIQNYFRMYEKLAGMTGTAITEAAEFWEIYKLDVVVIPTNKPCVREDLPDIIFKTKKQKYRAVVDEVKKWHKAGRPVLVGTASVDTSELLSRLLKREGIPHHVLNAKHHQKEAEIVSRAGEKYAVTIATNMAGRGTDIKLGEGVKELGGLLIVGTEKHEARRIDRQLRGRSGRQGDPGTTRFFLSLEDDLLRLFGSDKVMSLMERFGSKDEGQIESKMVTKALETAQKRVEMQNFEIRKRLLEFDDVMNKQREVVYGLRNEILDGGDVKEYIKEYIEEIVDEITAKYCPSDYKEDWDIENLRTELSFHFLSDFRGIDEVKNRAELKDYVMKEVEVLYNEREEILGEEKIRELERMALLYTLDEAWRDHLYSLDHLREGIYLRAYGQKDPLVEYKQESYRMFEELMRRIRNETVHRVLRVQVAQMPQRVTSRIKAEHPELAKIQAQKAEPGKEEGPPGIAREQAPVQPEMVKKPFVRKTPKIGRNDPCPCGSGKKYKHCCGRGV